LSAEFRTEIRGIREKIDKGKMGGAGEFGPELRLTTIAKSLWGAGRWRLRWSCHEIET
jgi:hypothetical protein